MPYPKRTTSHLTQADVRLAGLHAISKELDFGDGLSVAAYAAAIASQRRRIAAYNTLLSKADEAKNLIDEGELLLKDFSERMLTGVATVYGKNSDEYEMAGGMKKSERKRKPRARKADLLAAAQD